MVIVVDLRVYALDHGRIGDIMAAVLKVLVFMADLAGVQLHGGGIRAAFGSGILVCWWPLLQAKQVPSSVAA